MSSPYPVRTVTGQRTTGLRTLVLGASENPARYSYLATERLLEAGHEPLLVGAKEGKVFGLDILTGMPDLGHVHTVTLYINPQRQVGFEEWLLAMTPERVIFNPGTENPAFAARLREQGAEVLPACTLVMLASGSY